MHFALFSHRRRDSIGSASTRDRGSVPGLVRPSKAQFVIISRDNYTAELTVTDMSTMDLRIWSCESMTVSLSVWHATEWRSTFTVLRQWRLHMSEKFSSRTKKNQTNYFPFSRHFRQGGESDNISLIAKQWKTYLKIYCMHCLKFTRHYYTPIHFKRIAEKYLLNVCRPNFAVNHIFYQDYVPYNKRGSLNQQKYVCPKLKYEGHLKKSGLLPKKKKILVFKTSLYI